MRYGPSSVAGDGEAEAEIAEQRGVSPNLVSYISNEYWQVDMIHTFLKIPFAKAYDLWFMRNLTFRRKDQIFIEMNEILGVPGPNSVDIEKQDYFG